MKFAALLVANSVTGEWIPPVAIGRPNPLPEGMMWTGLKI